MSTEPKAVLYDVSSITELPARWPEPKIKCCFMETGEKIEWALEHAGITQADMARRLGITPQAVNGWIRTGTIDKSNLAAVARETGVPLEWLSDKRFTAPFVAETSSSYRARGPRGIPVVGLAVANPDGDGFFDDQGFPPGAGAEYVPWPSRDPNAYALRVRGDSMQDRIRHGDIVVVEPSAAILPGDDVVVRTREGRKMVKRLRHQRGGEVTLGSVNQAHRELTISVTEIESMHRVAAIVPRGTFTEEG